MAKWVLTRERFGSRGIGALVGGMQTGRHDAFPFQFEISCVLFVLVAWLGSPVAAQTVYDFSINAGVDRFAYAVSIPKDPIPPTVNNIPSTEIPSFYYSVIAFSNASRWDTGTVGGANRAAFRAVFSIAEAPTSITQLDVLWEGGAREAASGQGQVDVWVWNAVTSSYVLIGSTTSAPPPDAIITQSFTTSPSDYVDAANAVTLLVTNSKNNNGLKMDYVKITVTAAGCSGDFECDDGNGCTVDTCVGGACENTLEPAGTVCRVSTDLCDAEETCDGVSAACPADAVESAGTVCRTSTDLCDAEETCDGVSASCPVDAMEMAGTVCQASAGLCDPEETCNGASAACPADVLESAGTICRASTDLCDAEETCDGVSASCPVDAMELTGTVCRVSAGLCDPEETCDGVSAACPADVLESVGTVCRTSTDLCDAEETCDGVSASCPVDTSEPDGTACASDGDACTSDECSAGVCVHPDTTPVGQCCDPVTGTLTPIDDGDPCTTDICNPDGTVDHNPGGQITVNLEVEALAPPTPPVTRDVTFVITVCSGTVDARVVPVSFDSVGEATVVLDNVDASADWISVSEGHTLRRLEPLSIVGCGGSVSFTGGRLLLTGDLHTVAALQDNQVDITDFSILASRWNDLVNADESTGADVTGDGAQNNPDFAAMQANFWEVGEAADACLSNIVGDGWQSVGAEAAPVAVTWTRLCGSVAVESLVFPDAHKADLNGDGVVDTKDIRAFALRHGLELLPEFNSKLARWDVLPRPSPRRSFKPNEPLRTRRSPR